MSKNLIGRYYKLSTKKITNSTVAAIQKKASNKELSGGKSLV